MKYQQIRRFITGWHQDQQGHSSVLTLGVFTVLLMLVAVLLSATSVNMQSRQLLTEADAAASAAVEDLVSGRISGVPTMTEAQVRTAVADYLETSGAYNRHQQLAVVNIQVSDNGQTAHVELAAAVQLPVLRWILPAEIPVQAESHARLTVDR